jgi:hypothetical protein
MTATNQVTVYDQPRSHGVVWLTKHPRSEHVYQALPQIRLTHLTGLRTDADSNKPCWPSTGHRVLNGGLNTHERVHECVTTSI